MGYNATIQKFRGGRESSVTAAEVEVSPANEVGSRVFILRTAGHFSYENGTREYDRSFRAEMERTGTEYVVLLDGAQLYRNQLAGLALPASFR